jgi:hypothetical protein
MSRPRIRAALLVLVLGVLAGNGVAAGSASADTTAVTCEAGLVVIGFSDSHCTVEAGPGSFFHRSFPENTSSPITVVSIPGTTAATVKAHVMGVEVSIVCTTASGTGILNTVGSGATMYSEGYEVKITFGNCTVESLAPGCVVHGGTVTTKPLVFTTKGQGMGVKVEPELGSVLAEITIENCPPQAANFNGTWPLKGSVVMTPHGATLTSGHTETTVQGTLTWFGANKAGLTSSLTLKGPNGDGLAFTT